YTLEANPESLTPAILKDLFALGANRLSLGVQSFVDTELAALGRVHDAPQAISAIQQARERFDNLSLDLICGIPGQTEATWTYSLEQALDLDPEHLSIYPLQIEEGTRLAQQIASGSLTAPQEDDLAVMMQRAETMLSAQGYHRYEVASYAKPGRESKHNSAYWSGIPYLGLGVGAASMINHDDGTRVRSKNGEEPEFLSAKEALAEDLLLAMRMAKGVSEEQLVKAGSLLPQAQEVFRELQDLELVVLRDHRYQPTKKGWLLGNELYSRIWALAE
ncbi:MAG: coproporphyrinogen III oxidase family protein, partial [Coriobacteriales bacterium]|nr:coproporphyrinogen III oxidase family protein [Coriobacteriales bacterium]